MRTRLRVSSQAFRCVCFLFANWFFCCEGGKCSFAGITCTNKQTGGVIWVTSWQRDAESGSEGFGGRLLSYLEAHTYTHLLRKHCSLSSNVTFFTLLTEASLMTDSDVWQDESNCSDSHLVLGFSSCSEPPGSSFISVDFDRETAVLIITQSLLCMYTGPQLVFPKPSKCHFPIFHSTWVPVPQLPSSQLSKLALFTFLSLLLPSISLSISLFLSHSLFLFSILSLLHRLFDVSAALTDAQQTQLPLNVNKLPGFCSCLPEFQKWGADVGMLPRWADVHVCVYNKRTQCQATRRCFCLIEKCLNI